MFFFIQRGSLYKQILQKLATVFLLIISIVNALPALQLSTDIFCHFPHCDLAFPDLDKGNTQGNLEGWCLIHSPPLWDYEGQSAFSQGPSKEHSITLLVCSSQNNIGIYMSSFLTLVIFKHPLTHYGQISLKLSARLESDRYNCCCLIKSFILPI